MRSDQLLDKGMFLKGNYRIPIYTTTLIFDSNTHIIPHHTRTLPRITYVYCTGAHSTQHNGNTQLCYNVVPPYKHASY